MDFQKIKYIVEVAQSGSLSRAAKKLHITQSALSQAITKVEVTLGIKIFNRSRTGTTPTEIGEIFILKATDILRKYDELLRDINISATNILKIGSIVNPTPHLVRTVIEFKEKHPNIHVDISEENANHIVSDVIDNNLDIGILSLDMTNSRLAHPELKTHSLVRSKIMVAAHKDSPLANKSETTLKEISKLPFVLYDHITIQNFITAIESQHGSVDIVYKTKSMTTIRNAVSENLGVTIGPEFALLNAQFNIDPLLPLIDIVDLKSKHELLLIWSNKGRQTAIIKDFFTILKSNIDNFNK